MKFRCQSHRNFIIIKYGTKRPSHRYKKSMQIPILEIERLENFYRESIDR